MLNRIKKFLKKIEKRDFFWYPFAAGNLTPPVFSAASIPSVQRACGLYANLAITTPLVCQDGGPLPDWLLKPCPFLSRNAWLARVVFDYWLQGNFYAYIQRDGMKITGLLPFWATSIRQYSKGRDPSDPLSLSVESNRYYQSSYKGKDGENTSSRFLVEDIYHLLHHRGEGGDDFLNGPSISELANETLSLATETINAASAYSRRNFVSPSMVTGFELADDAARRSFEKEIETFLELKKGFLTLGKNTEIQPLIQNNIASLLMTIQSISTTSISRLFSVPISLLGIENGSEVSGGQAVKETFRFWIRNSGRAFLQILSDSFSELAGKKIVYQWRSHQASDLREAGQSVGPLVEQGIIDKGRAREWLE